MKTNLRIAGYQKDVMKNILLALIIATATLSCSKSNSDDSHIAASQVPSNVINAFNTRYPTASGQIEWELEHGNEYKVKFFIGAQRWESRFTSSGDFIAEAKI